MWTSPVVTTNGTPFSVANPALTKTSSPAHSVQVANASPWVLNVQTLLGEVAVQPFEASTLPAPVASLAITPGAQLYSFATGTVTVAWMLDGEQPPQPDGPLTAAATIAAITGTITTQQTARVVGTASYSGSGTATISGFLPTDQWVTLIPETGGIFNNNPTIVESVSGGTTGIPYFGPDILAGASFIGGTVASGQWRVGFPIFGALDSSLSITTAGTGTYGVTAIASPFPLPEPVIPVQQMQLVGVAVNTQYVPNPTGATYLKILKASLFVNAANASVILQANDPWSGGAKRVAEAWTLSLASSFAPMQQLGIIVQTPVFLLTSAAADGLVYYQALA